MIGQQPKTPLTNHCGRYIAPARQENIKFSEDYSTNVGYGLVKTPLAPRLVML